MSNVKILFKPARLAICLAGASAILSGCNKGPEEHLSQREIEIRANHNYWEQVASITNVCASSNESPADVYDAMPDKLNAIPTENVDPQAVRVVHTYLAPSLARFANFDHMQSELPWKIGISIGLALATLGGSEAVDAVDAADGADAALSAADAADAADGAEAADGAVEAVDGAGEAAEAADAAGGAADTADTTGAVGEVTDAANNAIQLAQLTGVSFSSPQMASLIDKIDIAGGFEAFFGHVPSRGFLGIGAFIKYNLEKPRIPKFKHLVDIRIGHEIRSLQAKYGGTFRTIHLNTPRPCG